MANEYLTPVSTPNPLVGYAAHNDDGNDAVRRQDMLDLVSYTTGTEPDLPHAEPGKLNELFADLSPQQRSALMADVSELGLIERRTNELGLGPRVSGDPSQGLDRNETKEWFKGMVGNGLGGRQLALLGRENRGIDIDLAAKAAKTYPTTDEKVRFIRSVGVDPHINWQVADVLDSFKLWPEAEAIAQVISSIPASERHLAYEFVPNGESSEVARRVGELDKAARGAGPMPLTAPGNEAPAIETDTPGLPRDWGF